ncbi:MAG: diguanylate cyclase [bacterium]|nr:diguanylate cyclase [bacterium]
MSATGNSAERPTVLIVDDESTNIRVLAEILQNLYQLRFATDGEKALEIATTQKIDLILLDVVMPKMNGYEVCRRLKSVDATHKIPIIFVTSMGEVEDETQGFALGGVDYITKPVSPPVVRARVKTHLALKEQTDLLEQLSLIDFLTKIPNRRRFDEVLQREFASAGRSKTWFTLMILDVDFFKQYNDSYGHTRGDDCLREIAMALELTFSRPTDLVARYGGEEFGIVLRDTGFEGSCNLVEKIHENLQKLELSHLQSSVADRVTVSLGAVSLVPDQTMTPTALLEKADTLLYEAKENGRMRGICMDLTGGQKRVIISNEGAGG